MTQPLKVKKIGLNRLHRVRNLLVDLRRAWFRRVFGMDLHPTVQMSLSAKLKTCSAGVIVSSSSKAKAAARWRTHT